MRDRLGLLFFADIAGALPASDVVRESALDWFQGRDRRHVAIVVTSDGRRVQMPLNTNGLNDGSLLGILRSLLVGFEDLLGLLITGSRRENGGTRREERR